MGFLPHFKALPILDGNSSSQACPFVQGETFYLQATFRQKLNALKLKGTKVLTPLLDLTKGVNAAETPMVETAMQMGVKRKAAVFAFEAAVQHQLECMAEMGQTGKRILKQLEADPKQTAVVIFARPYS